MEGQKLRKILAAEGITATDLARMLGCTRQNVSYLFQSRSVKLDKLQEIAQLVGKTVDDFILPDRKSDRVEELEKELEKKNQEIANLNARIDKLLAILEKQ